MSRYVQMGLSVKTGNLVLKSHNIFLHTTVRLNQTHPPWWSPASCRMTENMVNICQPIQPVTSGCTWVTSVLVSLYTGIYCRSEYVQHFNKNNKILINFQRGLSLLNLLPHITTDRPEIIKRSKHNACK